MAKQSEKIDISNVLAPLVSSRDVVDTLRKEIEKIAAKQVDLDFSKVEFLSRSAAHELLKMREDFSNKFLKKKVLNFVNADNSVAEMLRVVAANRAIPRKQEQLNVQRVNISSLIL